MKKPGSVFSFGPYTADPVALELRKLGAKLRLRPQPFRVLQLLLERSGQVVTREELRAALWASDTFVDFEHGLNTAVKELRGVLNDSASNPKLIETLPRVGYRFIGECQAGFEPQNLRIALSPGIAHAEAAAIPLPPRRQFVVGRAIFASAAFAIAGLVAYCALSPPPAPKVSRFLPESLTQRHDSYARIISDGVRVYFLERQGDHDNLVQTSVEGGSVQRVDAPFRGTRIFDVSADHREFLVGNFVARGTDIPLWIWPTHGGSPVRVGNVFADDAAWTPGAQQILYVHGQDIRIVRRDGAADRVLIHTAGYPRWIRWHPDGTRFVYTVTELQADAQTLWVSDADGSHVHPYFSNAANGSASNCCAEWTQDGKYLLFTSNRSGANNLWALRQKRFWLHWQKPAPVQLTPSAHALAHSALVRDDNRAFAEGKNEQYDFVRYDLKSRQFSPLPSPDGIFKRWFSKDGAWVVAMSLDWTLWSSRADGSERLQLTNAPLHAAQVQWSPDGKTIAFEGHFPGQPVRAYLMNARGGPPQEVVPFEGEQYGPSWSPDGSTIAVALNLNAPADSSLPRGIFLVNVENHKTEKLAGSEGYTTPQWSPDGKYFIAKTDDEKKILLFDQHNRAWSVIAQSEGFSGVNWSPDSQFIYAQTRLEPGQPIYRFSIKTLQREFVASCQSWIDAGAADSLFEGFLPDGSLVVRNRRTMGEIFVLDLDLP